MQENIFCFESMYLSRYPTVWRLHREKKSFYNKSWIFYAGLSSSAMSSAVPECDTPKTFFASTETEAHINEIDWFRQRFHFTLTLQHQMTQHRRFIFLIGGTRGRTSRKNLYCTCSRVAKGVADYGTRPKTIIWISVQTTVLELLLHPRVPESSCLFVGNE